MRCGPHLEIPIESLEVEVHSDFDARGELGAADDVRPGHTAIRYIVRITSDASDDRIRQCLDTADAHSSWRDNLLNPVPMVREVQISPANQVSSIDGSCRPASNSAVRMDRAVDHYERLWSSQLKPVQDRLIEMSQLRAGARVLEISCGTGLVTWPLADIVGKTGYVLATDISERMVERTANEATRRGLTQVTCRRVGAEAIDEPDGTFDAVVCALGLMYVPEAAMALAEMHRVLTPGGRVVIAVWGARAHCAWAEVFPIVESRVASDVCPMFFQLGTSERSRRR